MDINSLLGWISAGGMLLMNFFTSGKRVGSAKKDLDNVKKACHTPPCKQLQDTKNDIVEIKTDIKWIRAEIEKYNGRNK